MQDVTPSLAASGVCVRYGTTVALDEVSIDVRAGECVALVGESGSGKTTLLRAFNRLTVLERGCVRVEGKDAATLDPVGLRRRIGYVPQEGGLLPHWSVERNVALVPTLLRAVDPRGDAHRALDLVDLSPSTFAARRPHELSGGQRQRVAIARALAASPHIVLLDEPFGALDALTRADVQAMFDSLRRTRGFTAVLVTHDLHEALRLADRIAVLRAGRIEQLATPSDLVDMPATPYVRQLLVRARVIREGHP